jgi:hypothetical protein
MVGGGVLVLAAFVGCYTGPTIDSNAPTPTTSVSPTDAQGGLPCDVADLLATQCSSCHGDTLAGGATVHLLGASDLAAPSTIDPSKTVGDDSVARMKDTTRPMPPTGPLAPDQVAILEKWVAAGMPAGTCDPSAGTTSYDTPTICTSGTKWTRGDHGSKSMHPGVACINCHDKSEEAPGLSIAGTLYPTAHEPDDCNGTSGATIVITDAKGATHSIQVNSAGNFYLESSIPMPYTAKVVAGDKTRAMTSPQKSGDCNSCHSEQGANEAPGRIMAP